MMMLMISCSSNKKITSSSTIETSDNTSLVSHFLEKNLSEDIHISWDLEDESDSYQIENTSRNNDSIKPPRRRPPKKGKIHIRITGQENISNQHITEDTQVNLKHKEKNKNKKVDKSNVKSKSSNILINSIIIIIFGIIVKFLFSRRKSLKKIWNKIKKSLTLRHP